MIKQANVSFNHMRDIFIPQGINKHGYRVNVNHPKINALLRRYKRWKGIRQTEPLSDKERLEFENYIMGILPPAQT